MNILFYKHSFDIIAMSEHKINKNSMNVDLTLSSYTFYFNETKKPQGRTDFFITYNLTFNFNFQHYLNLAALRSRND